MRQGIPLFGVLGVLLQAKRMGKIERIAPALDQMQKNGYRISQERLAVFSNGHMVETTDYHPIFPHLLLRLWVGVEGAIVSKTCRKT